MPERGERFDVVGLRVPRLDAPGKATGEAVFTVDVSLPQMLQGRILRSPHPHARILHIDTAAAERLPGVGAVITGHDVLGGKTRGTYGKTPPDEQPLALNRVRFIGDEVAAVAAVDRDTAEEALDLIEVEYDVLPAAFEADDALQEDAVPLHDHAPDNISWRLVQDLGDVSRGLGAADHVQEDTFTTHSVCHGALEPHAAVARYESNGSLTMWASTQRPFFVSWDIAEAMGLPESRVRVIKPHVGGGFGGKLETSAVEYSAAFLSRKTGRPVKIVLDREEVMLAGRRRHSFRIDLTTGVKRDGTITARSCRALMNGGAYNSLGVITCYLTAVFLNIPYRCPAIHYEAVRAYTNNPPGGAMRGFGAPQMHFAVEVQMDIIAEALGMEPAEIRLKNALAAGDSTVSGIYVGSSGLEECIRSVRKSSRRSDDTRGTEEGDGVLRGTGMACNGFISGPRLRRLPRHTDSYAMASTLIRAYGDGKIAVISGSADIGQGSETMLAQIAAEELGIPYDSVSVLAGDTQVAPLDLGTYGSRVTMMAGSATKAAASDLRKKILGAVADELGHRCEDLTLRKGVVVDTAEGEVQLLCFQDAVMTAQRAAGGRPVVGEGCFNPEEEGPLDIDALYAAGIGNYSPAYSFGAHVTDVEVDPESGQVKLAGTTVAHDCGLALNPTSVEGQIEGCVSMGTGYALSEIIDSRDGLTMNPSFLDYRIPVVGDEASTAVVLVNSKDPVAPFGAKEAGEGPISAVAPSVVNAIHDAAGVWIKELPVNPERVLEALRSAEAPDGRPGRGGVS